MLGLHCAPRPAPLPEWIASIARHLLALVLAMTLGSPVLAAKPVKGTSSRSAREDAIRSIPYAQLDPDARTKVSEVLASTTIFRRMPPQVIDCDPTLFVFLVEHPDVVVNIWQVLGITEVTLNRLDDISFHARDGEGTSGTIEYLYRDNNTFVLYAQGAYEGSLLSKPLHGRCLMVLKAAPVREPNGRYHVTCRLDAFMRLENPGLEVLAKAFQQVVGSCADHNFRETTAFVASVSRAAEVNQAGVQRMARRLTGVEAAHRQQFAMLTEQVAMNAALNAVAQAEHKTRKAPNKTSSRRSATRIKR